MRWLTFALLAVVTICFQTTIAPRLGAFGCYPDFMLILVVHYTLHARSADGLLAGWLLGLLVDLTGVQGLGLVAVVYGLLALGIWPIRDLVFTRHPLTHFSLTFVACLVVQIVLRGYFHLAYPLTGSFLHALLPSVGSAVYTGLCAVVVHRILLRFSRGLGLRQLKDDIFASPSTTSGERVV